MPNVRASSGMIGTIRGPSSLSRMRFRRIRVKTIVVETGVSEPAGELLVDAVGRRRQRRRADDALRERAAERLAPLAEVLDLLRVGARVVVRRVLELRVRDRQLEPVAEDLQLGLGQLLRLVGDVAGLDARARASSP